MAGVIQAVLAGSYAAASSLIVPTIVNVGDPLGGAGSPTYTFTTQLITGMVDDDVLFAEINTCNETPPGAPLGWTYLTPYGSGTAATAGSVGLHTAWYRLAGGVVPTSVSFGDSGDHTYIRVLHIRGARNNAAPIVALDGVANNTSDPFTFPTTSTTTPQNLVLYVASHGQDVASDFANAWNVPVVTAGTSLHTAVGTTLGLGGGLGTYSGRMAFAGSLGTPDLDAKNLTQPVDMVRAIYAVIPQGA